MGLEEYRKKRDFKKTPEPPGKTKKPEKGLAFVVQKHAASHLHYDFRLELDGVLKSWAVPKGPSLDPSVKRLAMMVEDHPFDYRSFEGVIPEGNYGAGKVIVWDEGTYHAYETVERKESEKLLREGLAKGDLKFVLEGHKLRGRFALVKLKSREDNSWLLVKKKDEFAASEDITGQDRSVASGKTIDDIEAEEGPRHKPEPAGLANAPSGPMPHAVKPMHAISVKRPFDHPGWLFEIKLDGYRAIAEVERGKVALYSRNFLSFTERFQPVVRSLERIDREAVLDGEIVVLDEKGRSSFQLLQNYQRSGKGDLLYFVFDLLYLDGKELRELPLITRKEILRDMLPDLPNVLYTDHVLESGKAFFELARDNNLEGIIAKLASSRYLTGKRSREWLKIKATLQQEAVICGFTQPKGSRKKFGALVLGAYDKGELVYIGHSGGGFDEESLKQIHAMLLPLVQPHSPFNRKVITNMPATWVKPVLVCEVSFSEWTDEGIMRQPVFLGLREDKDPGSVIKETYAELVHETGEAVDEKEKGKEKAVVINGRKLKLTNLDKIFWPEEKYTKGDVIDYYRKIAEFILPYLKDRPESLYRTPNGIHKEGFFQKDLGEIAPDWATIEEVFSESNDKYIKYLICQDEAALVYMANLGCIEINPWLSRIKSIDYPDYFVIDLDPEDISFDKVVEAALAVKEVLTRVGIESFPKTSGATGLHIYVPLQAQYTYDTASNFAQLLAITAHGMVPDFTSVERNPGKRQKKVYLDFLQNKSGQTLAAPYSIRPRRGATVSTPLRWEEVRPGLDPLDFTIRTIHSRLENLGDIFSGVLGAGIDIEACLERFKEQFA